MTLKYIIVDAIFCSSRRRKAETKRNFLEDDDDSRRMAPIIVPCGILLFMLKKNSDKNV